MHISSQLPGTTNMLQQEVRYQENKTPPESAKLSVIYIYLFQFSLAPRKWFTKEMRDFAWHLHGSHLKF